MEIEKNHENECSSILEGSDNFYYDFSENINNFSEDFIEDFYSSLTQEIDVLTKTLIKDGTELFKYFIFLFNQVLFL